MEGSRRPWVKTAMLMALAAGLVNVFAVLEGEVRTDIPLVVHQMWLGRSAALPPHKELFFRSVQASAAATTPPVEYRLWRNADISQESFPLTWSLMHAVYTAARHRYGGVYGQTRRKRGRRHRHLSQPDGVRVKDHSEEVSRPGNASCSSGRQALEESAPGPFFLVDIQPRFLAAITDMARAEILFTHGGLWLDANMEMLDRPESRLLHLWRIVDSRGHAPGFLSAAIFDGPWDIWNTQGVKSENLEACALPTAFLMAQPGHALLRRFLSDTLPRSIETQIGKLPTATPVVTGPVILAHTIQEGDDVLVLPSTMFYPFMPGEWSHRCRHAGHAVFLSDAQITPPLCCVCEGPHGAVHALAQHSDLLCRAEIADVLPCLSRPEAAAKRQTYLNGSFGVDHIECGGTWGRALPKPAP